MNISELARNWSGKNGQDFFKTARQEIDTWEDYQAIIKHLREEEEVIGEKLKEATDEFNDVNNMIAYKALIGSLDQESSARLGKRREVAGIGSQQHSMELCYIEEAIKMVKETFIKQLREEAEVIKEKLKEATAELNIINNMIAYKALNGSLNGSLDEESSERLGKCREDAQKSSDAHWSDLYNIKEAIRMVTASW